MFTREEKRQEKGTISTAGKLATVLLYFLIKIKCSVVPSVGQRKNPSSRQDSSPWPPRHRLGTLTTELQRDSWGARPLGRFTWQTLRCVWTTRVRNSLIARARRCNEERNSSVCKVVRIIVIDGFFLITGQESEDDLGTGKQVRSKVWSLVHKVFILAFISTFVIR